MHRDFVTSALEAELIAPKRKTVHYIVKNCFLEEYYEFHRKRTHSSASAPSSIKARMHDLFEAIRMEAEVEDCAHLVSEHFLFLAELLPVLHGVRFIVPNNDTYKISFPKLR
jgi:hypothetical protein